MPTRINCWAEPQLKVLISSPSNHKKDETIKDVRNLIFKLVFAMMKTALSFVTFTALALVGHSQILLSVCVCSIRATSWSVALITYIYLSTQSYCCPYTITINGSETGLFYQINDWRDKNYIQCFYDYDIKPNVQFGCSYVSTFLYSAASSSCLCALFFFQ